MSRKDTLRAMLTRRDDRLPTGNPAGPDEAKPPEQSPVAHIRSGAVGAMSRSLGQIANAAGQAKALIAAGAAVIEIPTDKLDSSFVEDRLADDGPEYDKLVDAIREAGQRSPILVRPHPDKPDRYQIAFGHRRVRVLAGLGRPVRAVVQNLSDEELVVIQGQENSARTDLSYIERGLFAIALEERGFDRSVMMAALSMEKTQLSRLLSVAHTVPRKIAMEIGPAPKAGRPRWTALAERLEHHENPGALDALFHDPAFKAADSDTRFVQVFNALATNKAARKPRIQPWKDERGRKIATIERSGTKVAVVIDAKDAPKFGEFLAEQLPALHRAFQRQQEEGPASANT
jgi:ParB family chromosome partitioning protein